MSRFKVGDKVILKNFGGLLAEVVMVEVPDWSKGPWGVGYMLPETQDFKSKPGTQILFMGKPMIGVELEVMNHSWYPGSADPGYRPTGSKHRSYFLVPEHELALPSCPTCGQPRQ